MKDLRIGEQLRASSDLTRSTPRRKDNDTAVRPFGDVLKESIREVNRLQVEADQSIQELAIGRAGSVHETMIAVEKAEVSFRLMMQVRNKIVDAYHEIMRMQI